MFLGQFDLVITWLKGAAQNNFFNMFFMYIIFFNSMSEGCLHLHLFIRQMLLSEEMYTAMMYIFYQFILLGIEPMILALWLSYFYCLSFRK